MVIVSISVSFIKMLYKPLGVQRGVLRLAGWEVKEPGSSASVSIVPTRQWLLAVINGINEDDLGNVFYAISCSISLLYSVTFFLQIIVLVLLPLSRSCQLGNEGDQQ